MSMTIRSPNIVAQELSDSMSQEVNHGRILRKVQIIARDEGHRGHYHEEWPTCDSGRLPCMRDENVQDRQSFLTA